MQSITISGHIGKDAELRTVREKPVLNFNVGVKNGYGRDADSVWYRCALWGNAATVFADSLKKGTKVFIIGDLKHDEYEGRPQFNIDVKHIDPDPKNREKRDSTGNGADGYKPVDDSDLGDLSDECPF